MQSDWSEKHQKYTKADWIDKPSLFAVDVKTYFPKSGKILELGAGQGQDSRYFATLGYDVISTDLAQAALDVSRSKFTPDSTGRITLDRVDLSKELPYADGSFDIVYAHLSLHYFDMKTTEAIFDEIYRVLRPGGIFAFLVNSTSDPEDKTGTELEPYLFDVEGPKRYFTREAAGHFAGRFKPVLLDDKGETYKDRAKGVHNLIRFVGTKEENSE